MNWQEKFVPDPEASIALFTMQFPQRGTTFVWVDNGVLNGEGRAIYRLTRAVEIHEGAYFPGVFAAYTAEEFQTILPVNFVPLRTPAGTFKIIDLHQLAFKDVKKEKHVESGVGLVLRAVEGSEANTIAQSYANAVIYLIQAGALKTR